MSDTELEIGKNKVPITGYDLLGYIFPGAVLLACIIGFENAVKDPALKAKTPLINIISTFWPSKSHAIPTSDLPFIIASIILLILFTYLLGHIVATLSSILIDHIFIAKGCAYPYEHLLGFTKIEGFRKRLSRNFYTGYFPWISFFYIMIPISFLLPIPYIKLTSPTIFLYMLIVFFAKAIYQIKFFRNSSIWKKLRLSGRIYIFVHKYHSLPFRCIVFTIKQLTNAHSVFDEDFIKKYQRKFSNTFRLTMTNSTTNNFWLPYTFVVQNSSAFASLLANWLRLYSFSRNISMAFFLAINYILVYLWIYNDNFCRTSIPPLYWLIVIYIICGLIFLARFIYLFYSYFTKFTFRAFMVLESGKNQR